MVCTLTMLVGCYKSTPSSNVATNDISAKLQVIASHENEATALATLSVGSASSNTFVDLGNDDSLVASVGDLSRSMLRDDISTTYSADFSDGAENTQFTIGLVRGGASGYPSAVVSTGTLPAPFELDALAEFSRSRDDFTLTWSPSGTDDTMRVLMVNATCAISLDVTLPGDAGSYAVAKSALKSGNGVDAADCELDIEVTRTRKGSADAHFAPDSSFKLTQDRLASILSHP